MYTTSSQQPVTPESTQTAALDGVRPSTDHQPFHDPVQQRLEDVEHQLDTLQEESAELVALRAAKCWREKGERSNSYFYHCLRNRQKQQYIRALQQPGGSLVSQPQELTDCAQSFYQQLFTADPIEQEACDSLLASLLASARLTEQSRSMLLQPWTELDIHHGKFFCELL